MLKISNTIRHAFPFLLLTAYGVFTCSYFFFDEYSDPYRVFARGVFVLGVFVFISSLKKFWGYPLFQIVAAYMLYILLSGFWSDPFEWFRFGQKFTIAVYILCFISITYYLVHWDSVLYERMLQVCVLIAAVAAVISLASFYREHHFPSERLMAIGALTNINEFANVFGVFAILAMGFALRMRKLQHQAPFLLAILAFIAVAWFGQSRTAFTSLILALLVLMGFMLNERKGLYAAILIAIAGALVLLFPGVLEEAMLRGQGLRPMIWAIGWREAISAPLFGHGFITPIVIHAGDRGFATLHNAYLQVFWQSGLIGLVLFLTLLAVAFRAAWSWGNQHRDYTIFCLFLFAACTMMTGVDTLIDRPRDQWMLFWFPLALLLAHQAPGSPPGPGTTRLTDTNANKSSGIPG